MKPLFVAEVKTQSPFGFKARRSWDELLEHAVAAGDIISIHTDRRWGGSFKKLARARALTIKPILAKGIHIYDDHVRRALDIGADYVLTVGRVPADYLLGRCWVEPRGIYELRQIPTGARVVWNSRDICNGGRKVETWTEARKAWPGWLCQASNICSLANVEPDADAFIVGTHMPEIARAVTR